MKQLHAPSRFIGGDNCQVFIDECATRGRSLQNLHQIGHLGRIRSVAVPNIVSPLFISTHGKHHNCSGDQDAHCADPQQNEPRVHNGKITTPGLTAGTNLPPSRHLLLTKACACVLSAVARFLCLVKFLRGPNMRKVFVAELEGVGEDLVSMSRAVEAAMRDAANALLNCDVALAEKVIAADDVIDNMERELDDRCVLVLAQQAPVAGAWRTALSALRMCSRLWCLGDLAGRLAARARRVYPEPAIPDSVREDFRQMTDDAQRVSRRITRLLESRDVELAAEIEADRSEERRVGKEV